MISIKTFAPAIIVSLLAVSCAVEELTLTQEAADVGSGVIRTKSAPAVLSRRDSLRLLYEYQTRILFP